MDQLKSLFRPEFLNRVDEVVLFSPLTLDEVEMIVSLSLEKIRARLKDREIQLHMSSEAMRYIAEKAYDPVYGARPVNRYLCKHLETALGRSMVKGDIEDGSRVEVLVNGEGLTFETEKVMGA
jgi:ATP-dependent Clp protease ATP-binding subunit ClpB